MLKKLLVAQGGELAARILRTTTRLGMEALVALPPGAKLRGRIDAPIVEVPRGKDGSIDAEALAARAHELEVDAVYPGYASSHEHEALARILEHEDVLLVGADPDALSVLGSRAGLREIAERIGARMVAASGPCKDAADAIAAADALGYPVALRASAGGGPKRADDDDEVGALADTMRARAGDEGFVVERFVDRPRRLEVIVAADVDGEVYAIGDRECSLSAKGQRLLEEAPSPAFFFRPDGEALRESAYDTAIRLAAELRCPGLVQIGFLLDSDGLLWLSSARLGLSRHHAAVEMVTGLDLVELQLALAGGDPLGERFAEVRPTGNAIGAWLLATASSDGTLESIVHASAPSRKLRVEPSCAAGETIDPVDGALLAKVTAWAPIRHQAALALDRVLAGFHAPPFDTNTAVLRRTLAHKSFHAGQFDVDFLGTRVAL